MLCHAFDVQMPKTKHEDSSLCCLHIQWSTNNKYSQLPYLEPTHAKQTMRSYVETIIIRLARVDTTCQGLYLGIISAAMISRTL